MYTVRIKDKKKGYNEVVIENVIRVEHRNKRKLLQILCPYNTIEEYNIDLKTVEYCELFDDYNFIVWRYTNA